MNVAFGATRLETKARVPMIIRRISIGCLYPVTPFGSGQHRQETQHGLWRRAWGASVMAFWVDAAGRAPGSGHWMVTSRIRPHRSPAEDIRRPDGFHQFPLVRSTDERRSIRPGSA